MALEPGKQFGSYDVVEPIGAGGMGEVYRATDTALKRDVALKVLPQAFIQDADRLARFQREAEILASLNHPNIAQVYGLEKSDGQTAIVMELVGGPTLADRISEGPLPPDEAMAIGLQIVDALEAAHNRNVVHRDLKPANVKIRDDGTVKVLDFGISKPIDPSAISGGSPVATTPAVTQTGVILGTAAYMSPEQARGRFVDERTDVWAFGCLLFEMLTGQPAFGGEDVMLTLARVLDRDTDLSSMPKSIGPAVRQTIRLCLEKDLRKRIADIRDVRLALEGAFDAGGGVSPEARPESRPGPQRAIAAAAGLFVGALATGIAVWLAMSPSTRAPERFVVPLPDQTIQSTSPSIAFAPGGRSFAYLVGGSRGTGAAELHLRHLDRIEPEVLIRDDVVASPFFSPDETRIGFYTNLNGREFPLRYVNIADGRISTIASLTDNLRGASWGSDGWIVLAQDQQAAGLWRVNENGGDLIRLTTPADGDVAHLWPEILPGGNAVVFTIAGTSENESEIAVISLAEEDTPVMRLGVYGHFARYSPTGHLVFARGDSLWAVAFDPVSFETGEEERRLEEDVLTKGHRRAAEFSFSPQGHLVLVTGEQLDRAGNRLAWVDAASGNAQIAVSVTGSVTNLALAPNGTEAAVTGIEPGIRIVDLVRGRSIPLTSNADDQSPLFSPDSQQIVYGTLTDGRPDILLRPADGSGAPVSIAPAFDPAIVRASPNSWSATDILAFDLLYSDGSNGFGFLDLNDPERFDDQTVPGGRSGLAAVSPSGLWVAYVADDLGRPAIYVERLSDGGAQQQVDLNGLYPHWSADGTELTYLRFDAGPTAAVRVSVTGEDSPDSPLGLGSSRELFPWDYLSAANDYRFFDMAPTGDRFLTIVPEAFDELELATTVVVLNWLAEMERLGRLPDDV